MSRSLTLAALCTLLALTATRSAPAQTIYGVDGTGVLAWEFTNAPGGPCNAPNLAVESWPYDFVGPCGVSPPAPSGFSPSLLLGDIADDPALDCVIVTDGFSIAEYAGDPACATPPPGSPKLLYSYDTSELGPLTGMGNMPYDPTTGLPALWVTDGLRLATLLRPFFPCDEAQTAFGPCLVDNGGVLLTDVSWDPSSGLVWTCDADGYVASWDINTCQLVDGPVLVTTCGITPPLTGIAVDNTTPNFTGAPLAVYVTDGNVVAYINPKTGLPAPAAFAAPTTCTSTPTFLAGLAHSQHGINYGTNREVARLGSFGQSISPSTNYGMEIHEAAPGTVAFLILNFSFPGPGYSCPAYPGVGTTFWVNHMPPALFIVLGVFGPGCVPIPLSIPSNVPTGLEVFSQVVLMAGSGPPAVDATQGMVVTIAQP